MTAIYKKEVRTYFTHMMGYVFLAFMTLLIGIFFSMTSVSGQNPNFQFVLTNITTFFFILIPVLTMRLFSEEARQKTDQLLFTSPLSVTQIVLGKFFAAFTLFLAAAAISVLFPVMVFTFGNLPVSQIIGAYIGFILIGAACIAVGVFISVLTDNQIIAAVATMGATFVMFIMDGIAMIMPTSALASFGFVGAVIVAVAAVLYNATKSKIAGAAALVLGLGICGGLFLINNSVFDAVIVRVMLWFSIYTRFANFALGVLNFNDIVYYISFTALFIYFAVNVIEKRRWR